LFFFLKNINNYALRTGYPWAALSGTGLLVEAKHFVNNQFIDI